jgi:hypothetical protein
MIWYDNWGYQKTLLIQFNSIQFNSIQFNSIQFNLGWELMEGGKRNLLRIVFISGMRPAWGVKKKLHSIIKTPYSIISQQQVTMGWAWLCEGLIVVRVCQIVFFLHWWVEIVLTNNEIMLCAICKTHGGSQLQKWSKCNYFQEPNGVMILVTYISYMNH